MAIRLFVRGFGIGTHKSTFRSIQYELDGVVCGGLCRAGKKQSNRQGGVSVHQQRAGVAALRHGCGDDLLLETRLAAIEIIDRDGCIQYFDCAGSETGCAAIFTHRHTQSGWGGLADFADPLNFVQNCTVIRRAGQSGVDIVDLLGLFFGGREVDLAAKQT